MNLQNSMRNRLDILFQEFFNKIADNFDISHNELYTLVESSKPKSTSETCMHIMSSGKNKGKQCPRKALDNGYCGIHQNSASRAIGTLLSRTRTTTKQKGMTKTQLAIIEWLNTAVPQEETVLKKRSKGLLHEETDIIFTKGEGNTFTAIGKLNNKEIVKLSSFEVEVCEKRGWRYDEQAVEDSDSESDSED